MKDNSDVDAMGERGGDVGDGDCEGLKQRRRREVEEWRDEGAVVLGEDEADVATDGADEVTVAGAGDGEFGGEADYLWVGPQDLNVNGKKEFEQQMEVLGRLCHPNLIGLKAYYFARDEKLLVHEFMPNGNLFWLLHGNRGPGRTPLDWTTRLKIASGAARGLAFIHSSGVPLRLVHGNIKSTNVLIDKLGNAKLSDYGLSVFASPSSAPKSNGYRAPEAALDGRKLTSKSDVYSFGVLLLELLTGKCPSIVDNNGPGIGNSGVVDLIDYVLLLFLVFQFVLYLRCLKIMLDGGRLRLDIDRKLKG